MFAVATPKYAASQSTEANGMFTPKSDGKPYEKGKWLSFTVPFSKRTSADCVKLRKNLLVSVNGAIYNLEDDSSELKKVYSQDMLQKLL